MKRQPKTIGIYCVWSNSYAQSIAIAAMRRARAGRYRPALIHHEADPLTKAGYTGFFSAATASQFIAAKLPAVNVSQAHAVSLRLPSVLPDNRAAGRMAAEHLLARCYRTILYVARPPLLYSHLRGLGVREAVAAAGGQFIEIAETSLRDEVRHLPLPAGIVGTDDTAACAAMELVAELGHQIPDQVAVVGITNEEVICSTALLPLSSVDLNPFHVGDQAARLLLRLLAGASPPAEPILIPPVGVVVRASSDTLGAVDPKIAHIVHYAREQLASGIRIQELARRFGMSRQHLSLLFRQRASYTPVEMLQLLAVARAKQLLTSTELSLAEVATECGYDSLTHFCSLFHKLTGITPAAHRASNTLLAARSFICRTTPRRPRRGPRVAVTDPEAV